MKIKTVGFVFMEHGKWSAKAGYQSGWTPVLWSCRVADTDARVFVSEQEFEVEVPEDFNPVPAQVAALEAQKLEALQKYQQAVAELNERLSKLLPLETRRRYEPR